MPSPVTQQNGHEIKQSGHEVKQNGHEVKQNGHEVKSVTVKSPKSSSNFSWRFLPVNPFIGVCFIVHVANQIPTLNHLTLPTSAEDSLSPELHWQ